MPGPSSTTFERPDLGTSFSEFAYAAESFGFVGMQCMPPMPVGQQSAKFSRVTVESLLKDADTLRAPGGGYSRDEWEFEQDSYATNEYGHEVPLDDRERRIYAYTGMDFDQIAADRARDIVIRAQEKRIADLVQDSGGALGVATTASTAKWDVPASATPVTDVLTAHDTFKAQCGMLPNALVITDKQLRKLKLIDEITDLLKYSGYDDPKVASLSMLAALFELERVIVAGAVRNTADAGQAASFGNVWDDTKAVLLRIPRSMDLKMDPGFGRCLYFSLDVGQEGVAEQYRSEERRSDIMRFRIDCDEKVLYTACAHILTGVL